MSLIRKSNQRTFLEIFPTIEDFNQCKTDFPIFVPSDVTDEYFQKTYYLLITRYGDNPISSYLDENRWKLKLWQVISEYAPEWQAKTELQKTIRSMTLDQFADAGKVINNTALNPNTAPSDSSLEELEYINQQNVARKKVSDADAINRKLSLMEDGLDDDYLDHFKKLFSPFTLKDIPLYLYREDDDDE